MLRTHSISVTPVLPDILEMEPMLVYVASPTVMFAKLTQLMSVIPVILDTLEMEPILVC